ncbi:MAG: hypothetical protein AAGF59_00620, partial [Pseudomonadota bacterium]
MARNDRKAGSGQQPCNPSHSIRTSGDRKSDLDDYRVVALLAKETTERVSTCLEQLSNAGARVSQARTLAGARRLVSSGRLTVLFVDLETHSEAVLNFAHSLEERESACPTLFLTGTGEEHRANGTVFPASANFLDRRTLTSHRLRM